MEVHSRDALVEQLADARTALVALLGTDRAATLSVAEVSALAREHDVPVLVDAASERLANPNPYLEAGATMVAYSGGKYLRGPQCTGLLLGDAQWFRQRGRMPPPTILSRG